MAIARGHRFEDSLVSILNFRPASKEGREEERREGGNSESVLYLRSDSLRLTRIVHFMINLPVS